MLRGVGLTGTESACPVLCGSRPKERACAGCSLGLRLLGVCGVSVLVCGLAVWLSRLQGVRSHVPVTTRLSACTSRYALSGPVHDSPLRFARLWV